MTKKPIAATAAAILVALPMGTVHATTRVTVSSNITPDLAPSENSTVPQVLEGSYLYGSTFAKGLASHGALKAAVAVDATCDCSGPATNASAEFFDGVTINAGASNGQSGFVRVRLDYAWQMSSTLRPGYSGAWNVGDLALSFGGHSFHAREYRYSGPAFGEVADLLLPYETTSGAPQLLGASLGSYIEALLPVQFGTELALYMSLATSSQGFGATASVDAFNSAYWGGLKAYDNNMQEITFTAVSTSGTDYAKSMSPVPEPGALAMFLAGIASICTLSARRSSKRAAL